MDMNNIPGMDPDWETGLRIDPNFPDVALIRRYIDMAHQNRNWGQEK